MTEAEWNTCADPRVMLDYLRDSDKLSERKARLFAVAVCRRIWPLLSDERSREAVEVAEQFADGLAREEKRAAANSAALQAAEAAARAYDEGPPHSCDTAAAEAAADAALAAVGHVNLIPGTVEDATDAARLGGLRPTHDPLGEIEYTAQAALLRDIFGNPFRLRPPLAPSVLRWHDGLVARMANAVCDNRHLPSGDLDQARLAILVDSLEDAGCTDAGLLAHLRGEGPHVRGCWVIDLLLGKS
jgi:hypothetical protein